MTDTSVQGIRKPISEMKVGDRVIADTHWSENRYQTGVIVKLSPPGWVNFRNDADGEVWTTDPSNIRIVSEDTPRVAPLLKDGDVVERLKQFRLRWQASGDLTYLGKALTDAVVEIESLRKATRIVVETCDCERSANGLGIIGRPCDCAPLATGDIREAAKDIIASRSSTYKARNGRVMGIRDEAGEMMWIVPFDEMSALEAALATPAAMSADRIADATLTWMIDHGLLDAGNEYDAAQVLAVLDDLAPDTVPSPEAP